MSRPGKAGATPRATRASCRRSDISASPAPGYCTLTATSRSPPVTASCQRPRWTWPIEAAAAGAPSRWTSRSRQSSPSERAIWLAHRAGRHRRRGVLQPGQLVAVRRRDLVGEGGLEHAQRLAELHRPALELAERAEQLLGGALLHLAQHDLRGTPAEPLAEPHRLPPGVAEGQRRQPRRTRGGLAGKLGHAAIVADGWAPRISDAADPAHGPPGTMAACGVSSAVLGSALLLRGRRLLGRPRARGHPLPRRWRPGVAAGRRRHPAERGRLLAAGRRGLGRARAGPARSASASRASGAGRSPTTSRS